MPPTCHVQSHLPAGSRRPRAAIMPVSTGSRLTDSAQCSPWLTLQFSDAGAQFGKNFIHRPRQRTVERPARRILMASAAKFGGNRRHIHFALAAQTEPNTLAALADEVLE